MSPKNNNKKGTNIMDTSGKFLETISTPPKPEPVTFEGIMVKVSQLLVNNPRALDVGLFKTIGTNDHYYTYVDKTQAAYDVRKKTKDLLNQLWQSGHYNYQSFADALRLKVMDIQGLLDEEFIRELR